MSLNRKNKNLNLPPSSAIINKLFGRRPAILLACLVFIVGAFVMALAPDVWILIIGRVIVGLGIGIASMAVPICIHIIIIMIEKSKKNQKIF
jgi:MFS family permease